MEIEHNLSYKYEMGNFFLSSQHSDIYLMTGTLVYLKYKSNTKPRNDRGIKAE